MAVKLSEGGEKLSQTGLPRLAFMLFTTTIIYFSISGCTQRSGINPSDPAGTASTHSLSNADLELPAASLTTDQLPTFHAGKALAHQPWVKAPTITDARDGLGPLYNAPTCLACHMGGGRGILPADGKTPVFSALLRLSLPAESGSDALLLHEGSVPHPVYGDQLQVQSTTLSHELRRKKPTEMAANGKLAPEAYLYIDWKTKLFTYPDGQQVTLSHPKARAEYLAYGPVADTVQTSLRVAPAIHGMGLIELIPQSEIAALADPDDLNRDGISGRVNQVWDKRSQSTQPGRFGLKANRSSLEMTVAGAFANDVGISNPLFPSQPCTQPQTLCQQQINGNNAEGFELPDNLLLLVTDFNRALGVPSRSSELIARTEQGAELFVQTGCTQCHHPEFNTAESSRFPQLGNQKIWPFSDFLLHDMGPDLADGRPDFLASGSEWRTAPLWGMASVIAISQRFHQRLGLLHDGRAGSVEEAILWHGGEAAAVRQAFTQLPQPERKALLQFVESL